MFGVCAKIEVTNQQIIKSRSLYPTWLFFMVCLVIVKFWRPDAKASEFEARGVLKTHDFIRQQVTDTAFRVSVEDCKWFIRIERFAPNDRELNTAIDVGSNGSNVYAVVYWSQGTNGPWNPDSAVVRPGPIPHIYADYSVEYIWLAFASSCYFDTLTNRQALPLYIQYSPLLYNLSYRVPVNFVRDATAPRLPLQITYFDDGIHRWWRKQTDAWALPPQEERLRSPLDHGFTNLVFNIMESIEVNALRIPKAFQVDFFMPNEMPKSASDLRVWRKTFGTVTNWGSNTHGATFLPTVPKTIKVREERFLHFDPPIFPFAYTATGGQWLSDAQVKELPEYRKQVKFQHRVIPAIRAENRTKSISFSTTTAKVIIWGIWVLLTLGVVILARIMTRKAHQQIQRQNITNKMT